MKISESRRTKCSARLGGRSRPSNIRQPTSDIRHLHGFTLLELIVAFALLALFVLPILEIMHAARVRAIHYTRERTVRDLAQRKLFDRIYSIIQVDGGTFEEEGHPDWTWEFATPQPVVQGGEGGQGLIQFTIRIRTPQGPGTGQGQGSGAGSGDSASAGASFSDNSSGGGIGRPAYELSIWAFPTGEWQEWLAEYQLESEQGLIDPSMMGNQPGGGSGY